MPHRILVMTLAVVLAAATSLVSARANSPTQVLRTYTEQVVRILEDPKYKADEAGDQRRKAVRQVAVQVFDVEEAARRALGRHWQARTPEERREFVELFADLLERTYIAQIDRYGGERLRFVDESVEGDRAVVRARVVTRQGTEIPVEARMLRRGDRWLMYDVVIEQLSLVANYRAQFDRIIRTASYEELVQRLRDRSGPPLPAPTLVPGRTS